MPEAAAAAVVEFFALEGIAATAATLATTVAVNYVASQAISAIFAGNEADRGSSGAISPNVLNTTIRQSDSPRRLVFGEVKTGGVLVWPGQTPDGVAHMLIAVSEGEIEGINPVVWLGDEQTGNSKFNGLFTIETNNGGAGKVVNAQLNFDFPTARTTAHKGQGVADVVARYTFNANVFPRGLILPVFLVKGIKCYDPRTGLTVWTRNPALVALYIERSEYGYRTPDALIDFPSFIAAANICDEVLVSIDPLNVVDAVPSRVRRYTFDGVFEAAAGPAAFLKIITDSCAGSRIKVGETVSFFAGAYRAPTGPVIDGHYLRGPATLASHASRQQRINIARGTYREPRQDWQMVDFAPQVDAALVIADQGEIVQALTYPATTVGATAQRLARMAMRRARSSVPLLLQCNWAAFQWQLWDVVTVNLPELGVVNQVFLIVEYKFVQNGGIDLTLIPEGPDLYAWQATDERAVAQIVVPDFGQTSPDILGLVVSGAPVEQAFGFVPTLSATWTAADFVFLKHYEVQWGLSSGTYTESATVTTASWATTSVVVDDYDVRVRVVSVDDSFGEWEEVTDTPVTAA